MTPQAFRNNVQITDDSEVELFRRLGSCYIWYKANIKFLNENIIPSVKHGDGTGMLYCLKAWVLKENFQSSDCDLKLKYIWVIKQDSDRKYKQVHLLKFWSDLKGAVQAPEMEILQKKENLAANLVVKLK